MECASYFDFCRLCPQLVIDEISAGDPFEGKKRLAVADSLNSLAVTVTSIILLVTLSLLHRASKAIAKLADRYCWKTSERFHRTNRLRQVKYGRNAIR